MPSNFGRIFELASVNLSPSSFGGGFLEVIGKNEFRLYIEIDSTNFGLSIVNFDYIQHSRIIGEGCRAIRGLLSRFFFKEVLGATRATRGQQ